jgi:hypothetical protein
MSDVSIPDLPSLPAADRRKLDLRLEKKNEELGFVGNAHLAWLKSPDMRRQAAFSRVRPNENYSSSQDPFYIDIATRRPIWQQSDLDALLNDRETDDLIGLGKTVDLAVYTYDETAEAYLLVWDRAGRPYEEFAALLEPLRLRTFRNVRRAKWPHRLQWFNRRVVPLANDEIDKKKEYLRNRARDLELARATPPGRSQPRRKEIEHLASGGTSSEPDKLTGNKGKDEEPENQARIEAARERRENIVRPRLDDKKWSDRRWAIEAGKNADGEIDLSVVYGYLAGKSFPQRRYEVRLAKVIGLEELPK